MPVSASDLPTPKHPLDAVDRPIIEALLQTEQPGDEDVVHAARLWTRHAESILSGDLTLMLRRVFERWQLHPHVVASRARAVWARPGWRPQAFSDEVSDSVGSGADVQS